MTARRDALSGQTGAMADEPTPGRARDLVRKRRGTYRAAETGRRHHIGGAPELMPLHTEDGVAYTRANDVQLASRTVPQLEAQRDDTSARMVAAARHMDYELAARLRDELSAVEAELAAR